MPHHQILLVSMRTGRNLQHSPLLTGQEVWKLNYFIFLEAPLTIKAVIKKVILWAVWKEITKTIPYHLIAYTSICLFIIWLIAGSSNILG